MGIFNVLHLLSLCMAADSRLEGSGAHPGLAASALQKTFACTDITLLKQSCERHGRSVKHGKLCAAGD